jgi:uncharacterized protein (TIGR01777 family)
MNGATLITGATGFIGGHLTREILARRGEVWALTRDVARARRRLPSAVRVIGELAEIPAGQPIDVVANLAGARVMGPPWTRGRRRLLIDSRVQTSAAVNAWCAARASRPRIIISASAIGYYGPAGDEWLDEASPAQPRTFQSQICVAREAAADEARDLGVRIVNLRIGLVLGADGGILPPLLRPARLGLAAVLGEGTQWMSWIHIQDLMRIFEAAIREPTMSGAINAVSPNPVRQAEFQRVLTRQLRRPLWLHVPGFALRPLGEMSELLLRGQRVAPRRLGDAGFDFRYPTVDAALEDLLKPARS